ncbi:MAG: CoA pyrophosphatase [Acidobacteriota bacterium]|nr:CoA pyrophosphatase [Acidobacteriota bacterium]MDQ7087828.1 CoA pyrophosphatase [Acidobacteriota bacterium]
MIDRLRGCLKPARGAAFSRGGRLLPAAVLVPVVCRESGAGLLLTLRTSHLAQHPGQVSFPGGRREDGESDPVVTALREAREEIGLDPARVEVAGVLPTYDTVTGFSVVPVVGLLRPPLDLRPDPREVAGIFEVALETVLDPACYSRQATRYQGEERTFWVLEHDEQHIWGVTAGILHGLCERLGGRSGGMA